MLGTEAFDWEAKVAIEIIEKTWEEIMMVGAPNTSGVNHKDFVKNATKHQEDESSANAPIGEPTKPAGSIGNGDSNATENQAELKACSDESTKLDDTSSNDVVSDAYRIQNEGIDASGKTASAKGQETEDDLGTSVPTVTESCKPRGEGEKGKANIDIDTGSSPLGARNKINDGRILASLVNPQEFAATAITTTTTSSPSAMHGIEAGIQQYPSRRIAEVMENTRCIFPAASKITSIATHGDHTTSNELLQQQQQNQKQPFITINPSYLESVTGDELLVAFDEIMAIAYTDSSSDEPCSFILPEEATSTAWIDLVRSYATTDTSTPGLQSIPLYILVLCRFQHSLARAYSGRSLPLGNFNDQENDSQLSTSHESSVQWLLALMTRIRELRGTNSIEIQRVLTNLASMLPEAGESVKGDEQKSHDLEQYLLLPFTVVAGRLGKDSRNNSNFNDVLKRIDSEIGDSLQEYSSDSDKEPLVVATASSSKIESAQAADGIGPDSNASLPVNESQNVSTNGAHTASNGGRKGKKKKKKKVCVR